MKPTFVCLVSTWPPVIPTAGKAAAGSTITTAAMPNAARNSPLMDTPSWHRCERTPGYRGVVDSRNRPLVRRREHEAPSIEVGSPCGVGSRCASGRTIPLSASAPLRRVRTDAPDHHEEAHEDSKSPHGTECGGRGRSGPVAAPLGGWLIGPQVLNLLRGRLSAVGISSPERCAAIPTRQAQTGTGEDGER